MTDPTERVFDLDRKHRALHSAPRFAIQKLQPDASYDTIATFAGGPRALLNWCRANDVHPSRETEEAISHLPEAGGFKDRT